jgi:osmoprotectant transport system permease protein
VDELLDLVELSPRPAATGGRTSCRADSSSGSASPARSRPIPRLMLLDEPFGALDPLTRDTSPAVRFLRIREQLGKTAIFVTHDMGEALLARRPHRGAGRGRLVQVGTPRELLSPAGGRLRPAADGHAERQARASTRCSKDPGDMSEQLALLPEYTHGAPPAHALGARGGHPAERARRHPGVAPAVAGSPVLGTASVIQTIPSLALLALMVPLLAALGVQSIGFLPAFIGLVLYSVLPILRNTVTGLAGIDPALVEAARASGMTPPQRCARSSCRSRCRSSSPASARPRCWTVGVATLSTPVGATSLGNYIFSGLQTRNYTAVLVGCVAAAALALGLDAVIRRARRGLRRRRPLAGAAAVVPCCTRLSGAARCRRFAGRRGPRRRRQDVHRAVHPGAAPAAGSMREATGRPAGCSASLGSTVLFDALRTGQIDVYVDYSGTLWATIMKREGPPGGPRRGAGGGGRFLAETWGIEIAASLGFENAYALAMRAPTRSGWASAPSATWCRSRRAWSSAATTSSSRARSGARSERPTAWRSARAAAWMPRSCTRRPPTGGVDVISAFSTDGRIAALRSRRARGRPRAPSRPTTPIVLAGARLARERPETLARLAALEAKIDADAMRRMNAAVDQAGGSPEAVAAEWLAAHAE